MPADNEEASNCAPEHFSPWLIAQVSSEKYPGLEWLNDEKTIFKIPWTKISYPMWEEHHKIFEAWAIHRGKNISTTGQLEQSSTQVKSNFRTILRKCVDIDEVEDAHQLGLQTGNYKVYRILSPAESLEKRKSQQQTRKAYKVLKQQEKGGNMGYLTVEGSNGQFLDLIRSKRKRKPNLKSFIPDAATTKTELNQISTTSSQHSMRNMSTQTYLSDTTDVSFILEPAAFEEAGVVDMDTSSSPVRASSLHNSVSARFDSQSQTSAADFRKTAGQAKKPREVLSPIKDMSKTLTSFQMLLEAALLAEGGLKSKAEALIQSPVVSKTPAPVSIVDVLMELKIPPEELFAYDMTVRYEARQVMSKTTLNDMSYGYRIHYGGNHKDKLAEKQRPDLVEDFARTSIALPESSVPPGNSLYAVLRNIDGGLVVRSDARYTLTAKRLCLSRIYAFTGYGEVDDAETEPLLLARHHEYVLFSYQKFLADWHRFLIEGSPKPEHEINFAFGKKTKHRHSRAFVSISLVPKAAETMLQRISETIDETTLDNVLRLFSGHSTRN